MFRNKIFLIVLIILTASCTPANKFIVTSIGYEPPEVIESVIYALPQTNLIIGLGYEKEVFLPGPYCDYALKMLGIEGVKRTRTESYKIANTKINKAIEADQQHFYSVNVLEGSLIRENIMHLISSGFLLADNLYSESIIEQASGNVISTDGISFKDVTTEPNVELRKETMYKTVLMDTSFVKVPVISEQLERKTLEKKAEEAAKLILEIRSDRHFISAGLLDPYPQDYDLSTALNSLDKLEEAYLSLFIGKSYTQRFYQEFFVSPSSSLEQEQFALGSFTIQDGFKPGKSLASEDALFIKISPDGKTRSLRNLLPQHPEEDVYNKIYYRIPELSTVSIYKANNLLHQERISIFQSGALVSIIQ